MSVVVVSTDESLPYSLQQIGLKTAHWTHQLVVGEATPAEARSQLRELGAGEQLSALMARIYGGNFWRISTALLSIQMALASNRKAGVIREPMGAVADAFAQWKSLYGDKMSLVGVLKGLARKEFIPLSRNDPLARVLTTTNVCTFLADDAVEYFVDSAVRLSRSGLVPSTQLVRVLIPVALEKRGLLFSVDEVGCQYQDNELGLVGDDFLGMDE